METLKKEVSKLTWFEMREEALHHELKVNGVSKQELHVELIKARKAKGITAETTSTKEFAQTIESQRKKEAELTINPPLTKTKYVAVPAEIAGVMNAKAIDKKPQLSDKALKKLDKPKTITVLKREQPGFSTNSNSWPLNDSPEIKKVLDLVCKKHIQIYKLAALNVPNKQIAELLGTNAGHVWNVLNDYSTNEKKRAAADLI